MKPIIYIAHPVSGDIKANLERILKIIHELNITRPDIIPFAHYVVDCYALNDDIPEQRQKGIENDTELLKRGFIDELWLYGNRISVGMLAEIKLAQSLGIPVVPMTPETQKTLVYLNYATKI
jgi:hypothetical protein